MPTVQELKELGEAMGLKGSDLRDFIKEQQDIEREERQKQREYDTEQQERQRAYDKEYEKHQSEERQREREYELSRLESEIRRATVTQRSRTGSIELEAAVSDNEQQNLSTQQQVVKKGPKIPPFDENRDNIDSFLHRFEIYASAQGWSRDRWSIYLSALLRGKALDVYSRLSVEASQDYDILKDALLKRFYLTVDGFMQKFRMSTAEPGETPSQFIARLERYLLRWMELAGVQQTFEGLKSLVIKEQYIDKCSRDMAVFLKERAPVDLDELAKLAERYLDAHMMGMRGQRNNKQLENTVIYRGNEKKIGTVNESVSNKRCYICSRIGHIAKQCRQAKKVTAYMSARTNNSNRSAFRDNNHGRMVRSNWREREDEHETTPKRFTSAESEQKQPMRCKTHKREACSQCMEIAEVHEPYRCNALMGDQVELSCGCKIPVLIDACRSTHASGGALRMPVVNGFVGDRKVSVLRDTGCSTVVINRKLVSPEQLTGKDETCILIDGTVRRVPVAEVEVSSPYFSGRVKAVCMRNMPYDVIIGNITEARGPDLEQGTLVNLAQPSFRKQTVSCSEQNTTFSQRVPQNDNSSDANFKNVDDYKPQLGMVHDTELEAGKLVQSVTTRAQEKKMNKTTTPLKILPEIDVTITKDELIQQQENDKTLEKFWQKARDRAVCSENEAPEGESQFIIRNDLLYRLAKRNTPDSKDLTQLVVPQQLRTKVLTLAHESSLSGHQGCRKVLERIRMCFWWPGLHGDVTRFCRSCDICQRTVARGRTAVVPLGRMPVIDVPFDRIAVDLIGPIFPAAERGQRYILTIMDYATRYPEAIALKDIQTETVAEAMLEVFTRLGVPREILSDQGSQFLSVVMKEVSRLLSINRLVTTPYHPICNGLVERFNGTLKQMLKKLCAEKPKDWDRFLGPLLFAYREARQESLGFSPFELLYGRTIRGPMKILKELWTQEDVEQETKTTYQYVVDLRQRLEETCEFAQQELMKAQDKQRKYYNRKSQQRIFKSGDKVLMLRPTDNNKLLMQWKGPFTVLARVRENDYRIKMGDKERTYHANLLKLYYDREDPVEITCAVVLEPVDGEESNAELDLYSNHQTETYKDVQIDRSLNTEQQQELNELIKEYQDLFTEIPGRTNLGEHSIQLTSLDPVRSKPYPLPHSMQESVDKEIDSMLRLGIIEPSTSAYASPIVVVKKPDGSNRICVDYRNLNKITVFDPEPMSQTESIFAKLSGDQFFSKFDLSKGYYQVPMRPEDKELTAFVTHRGLYQFTVMPFGCVNAPATFTRIMRKLLAGTKNLDNYLDDVLSHTSIWKEQLEAIRRFLTRVREAKMTLRPSKCLLGARRVTFLGHVLGDDSLQPNSKLVDRIVEAVRPTTKKQLRSFLGLVSFYRMFIPNFSSIAVPLTEMTRKSTPNELMWTATQERAFHTLKRCISSPPILRLPDLSKEFILQTDASSDGLGAVLLQVQHDIKHPIAFVSRKLLEREKNYSTIERECLAVVWGIQKFQNYLYGRHFVLEIDHQPLQYLGKAQYQNGRLMRWALALQPYRFTIHAIKGSENVGADFFSRVRCETI